MLLRALPFNKRIFLSTSLNNWARHFNSLPASADSHLHYEEILISPTKESINTSSPRLVVILHGLLGSGRNWRSFSKFLGNQVSCHPGSHKDNRGWRFLLVDQRNHGQSTSRGHSGPHTIGASAADLDATLAGLTPEILIGHSMGGKVVLEYLRQRGEEGEGASVPAHTWVLDSVPGEVPGDPHGAREAIKTLKSIPQPIPSRQWLSEYMSSEGYSPEISAWVGTSLVEEPGSEKGRGPLVWAFDVQGCEDMYNSYSDQCLKEVLQSPANDAKISLVLAEKSASYNKGMEFLENLDSKHKDLKVHTLTNAGHWVQVENPKGLAEIMVPSFIEVLHKE